MPSDSGSEEYPRAPAQKARDENILGVFEGTDDPVLTTSEVAEELPIGKRATLNRLEDLVDRDELDSKDVGVGRVWWRATPESESEPDVAAEPEPGPTPTGPAAPAQPAETTPPASEDTTEPLETESPRWAFIGSLGRHSILAGIFLFGLVLVDGIVQPQSLLPVSAISLSLTALVFFLIGFPARGAYRAKRFFESTDLSLAQFMGPVGRLFGRDDSKS
ncbi:hypothetical protein [Halorientalis regularis]|jgi:hypothetical protein|uniref:Uncharacterized protein n=1 Tax=Halorientalis regularis TaxID=660518 RepID=A0A1G7HYF2_9EURY|nr:hypothetical protein [Halorientalis regularis]SDF05363.1 hypothetical protein SAMN05216218_103204 [Halorientalis regularis]